MLLQSINKTAVITREKQVTYEPRHIYWWDRLYTVVSVCIWLYCNVTGSAGL